MVPSGAVSAPRSPLPSGRDPLPGELPPGHDLHQSGGSFRPRDDGTVRAYERTETWATDAYESFRSANDVDALAGSLQNAPRINGAQGFSRDEIAAVKQHIFEDTHPLTSYDGEIIHARYDPNPDMAEAWVRPCPAPCVPMSEPGRAPGCCRSAPWADLHRAETTSGLTGPRVRGALQRCRVSATTSLMRASPPRTRRGPAGSGPVGEPSLDGGAGVLSARLSSGGPAHGPGGPRKSVAVSEEEEYYHALLRLSRRSVVILLTYLSKICSQVGVHRSS